MITTSQIIEQGGTPRKAYQGTATALAEGQVYRSGGGGEDTDLDYMDGLKVLMSNLKPSIHEDPEAVLSQVLLKLLQGREPILPEGPIRWETDNCDGISMLEGVWDFDDFLVLLISHVDDAAPCAEPWAELHCILYHDRDGIRNFLEKTSDDGKEKW